MGPVAAGARNVNETCLPTLSTLDIISFIIYIHENLCGPECATMRKSSW